MAKPAKTARVEPVVKAVADPVTPTVKGGSRGVTPKPKAVPKATPVRPAGTLRKRKKAADAPPMPSVADAVRRAKALQLSDETLVESPARRAAALAVPVPETTPPPPPPEVTEPVAEDPPPAPAQPSGWVARQVVRTSTGDVVGEADERDHAAPVVPVLPERATLPPVLEEHYDAAPDDPRLGWPLWLRVVRGDWLPALRTAGPALAATLVVAAVGCAGLFLATRPAGDELLVGDMPGSRWLRYVAAAVGLAFGGPVTVSRQEYLSDFAFAYDVRFAPLTLTAASLVALWVSARRAYDRNVTPERVPDAIRTALLFAAGVVLVTRFASWSVLTGPPEEFAGFSQSEATTSFSVAPWRPLFWSFCAAFAVAWTATGQFVVGGRVAGWLLAARGALAGLAFGGAVSFLLLVVLGYGYVDEIDGSASDVTNAIPLALGYAPALGAGAFAVAAGGQLRVPVGSRSYWSLWAPWFPKWTWLLLVVPALAVAAAVYYLARRRDVPPAEVLRACGRLWLPAALAWWAVAAAGSLYLEQDTSFDFLGSATAGPVLWNVLLVGLWFWAGGRVAAWVLSRYVRSFDQPPDAT